MILCAVSTKSLTQERETEGPPGPELNLKLPYGKKININGSPHYCQDFDDYRLTLKIFNSYQELGDLYVRHQRLIEKLNQRITKLETKISTLEKKNQLFHEQLEFKNREVKYQEEAFENKLKRQKARTIVPVIAAATGGIVVGMLLSLLI